MWYEAAKGYFRGMLSGHIRRSGVVVLCYHGVVAERKDSRLERNLHVLSDFRDHVRLLKNLRVLSLSELLNKPQQREMSGKLSVVITFDDGYANTLLAHEILHDAGLPSAVFVSTSSVNHSLWTTELALLILHGEGESLTALGLRYPLETRIEREAAFQEIRYNLKRMPQTKKDEIMNDIRGQFPHGETDRLLEEFPSMRIMNWAELGQLKSAGVEIGSHGVHHEIHHEAQPREVRMRELIESKRTLEKHLGYPCRFFAFPNGDYCASSSEELHEAGYELGFSLDSRPQSGTAGAVLHRVTPPSVIESFVRQLHWEGSH